MATTLSPRSDPEDLPPRAERVGRAGLVDAAGAWPASRRGADTWGGA